MYWRVFKRLKIKMSGLLPALLERMRWSDLLLSSPSWWRQPTSIPGKTMWLAFIPTVCWWQEPLPIFVPTQRASNSCSLASPATSSCCPSGLGLRSSEITLCVQVWGKKLFSWITFYLCVFLFWQCTRCVLQLCCVFVLKFYCFLTF